MENKSTINYFFLLGISSDPQFDILFFLLFLSIYLITLLGNMLIMLVTRVDPQLKTPMYFFLFHLSFLDLCYSSVTVPKLLQNLLTEKKTISFHGCLTQMNFILMFGSNEVFMLSAMAYDRYVAICHPLHYVSTMGKWVCRQLVGVAWFCSLVHSMVNTVPALLYLCFCGPNEVNNFSCELPSLLALSCLDTFINEMAFIISATTFVLISSSVTVVSYIYIISTILKIRSKEGRRKAFFTCSSHLTVVMLFYGTVLFRYMRPDSISSVALDRMFSVQYSILTPMLNPIIYSLRNKEVKRALSKTLWKRQGT